MSHTGYLPLASPESLFVHLGWMIYTGYIMAFMPSGFMLEWKPDWRFKGGNRVREDYLLPWFPPHRVALGFTKGHSSSQGVLLYLTLLLVLLIVPFPCLLVVVTSLCLYSPRHCTIPWGFPHLSIYTFVNNSPFVLCLPHKFLFTQNFRT